MKIKRFFSAILFCIAILFSASSMAANQPFNEQQTKNIQAIIHDYLLDNPKLIVKALQKLQKQESLKTEEKVLNAIKSNYNDIFNSSTSPTAGSKQPKVILVEFFDYQCPHCKSMTRIIDELLKNNKQLQVVFKELPIFPGSLFAAKAALAANKQNLYLAFHNALMKIKAPLTKEVILKTAKNANLNIALLETSIENQTIQKEINANIKLANELELVGTPAFIIQNAQNKDETFFVSGQVSEEVLQSLINKVQKSE